MKFIVSYRGNSEGYELHGIDELLTWKQVNE